MINLMYLIDRYDHDRAGTEKQFLEILKRIDKNKFRLHVIVLSRSIILKNKCRELLIEYVELKRGKLINIASLIFINIYIIRNNIDIVHTFFIDSIFYASITKILNLKLKVITSRRDLGYWYSPVKLFLLRLSNLICDKILANSEAVREVVHLKEKAHYSKIDVIYNGISSKYYEKNKIDFYCQPRDESLNSKPFIVFGFIGNFRPVKRPLDFINALSLFNKKYKNWKAIMIGDGKLMSHIKKTIKILKLEKKIMITGSVNNPLDYFHIIDIGILCSESEGFPNSLLEMRAFGIPLIGTFIGGSKEIIQDDGGLYYDVGNIEQLSECLLFLTNDFELRRKISKKSLNFIKKYNWNNIILKYEDEYLKLFKA